MLFRQLIDYDTFTYTYLIASAVGREAVLIDPVKTQTDKYIQLIQSSPILLPYFDFLFLNCLL
jgi:hypothetical protein